MRAIWSFWSKPFEKHRHATWLHPKYHLYSWVLSLETTRKHYPETVLYTDDRGARLLVDELGLRFSEVSTSLNALSESDPGWWALGKLFAYSRQEKPFVHVDSDVYLWKALPESLTAAPVFAQNPEPITIGQSCYEPNWLEWALESGAGTWLPEEWRWYRSMGAQQVAPCCGILGGCDVDFIRLYADAAIRMVESEANREALTKLGDKVGHAILIEQYFLSACVEYHRGRSGSPHSSVELRYLFNSYDEAADPAESTIKGYTHLASDTKNNVSVSQRLEARIQRQYPWLAEACVRVAGRERL